MQELCSTKNNPQNENSCEGEGANPRPTGRKQPDPDVINFARSANYTSPSMDTGTAPPSPSQNQTPARGNVLVGVTGCIAAYKACELVRALQKRGYAVRVVMTEHATHLVGPATFRALTNAPVGLGLFDAAGDPIHHISLSDWADVFAIAPATANVIAKVACGIADDLLTTTALAARGSLLVAPAMNTYMYDAVPTQENLARLSARGVTIVEPTVGRLACGDTGRGHLAEVEDIANAIEALLDKSREGGEGGTDKIAQPQSAGRAQPGLGRTQPDPGDEYFAQSANYTSPSPGVAAQPSPSPKSAGLLAGRRVLITSGRTEEPIDPVRFISNRSSGKMGEALAAAAADEDARVTVITGPADIDYPDDCRVVHVKTACDMLEAACEQAKSADIVICAAAVADFRPRDVAQNKLKKSDAQAADALSRIDLVQNPDILATLCAMRNPGQLIVGFAAETQNIVEGASEKLTAKGADFIVANKVGDALTFGQDEIKATLVGKSGVQEFPEMPKYAFAQELIAKLATFLPQR